MEKQGIDMQLSQVNPVKLKLEEQLRNACSVRETIETKLSGALRGKVKNVWRAEFETSTVQLYGGRNKDGFYTFKIDHALSLDSLANDTSVKYTDAGIVLFNDRMVYDASEGTEFIILPDLKINIDGNYYDHWAYAIRADKYPAIRHAKLLQRKIFDYGEPEKSAHLR